jgi:hypothetical protein
MRTIKEFENGERRVTLRHTNDGQYSVSILTSDGKSKGTIYKSLGWAIRKFIEYKNNPLEAIKF